MLNQRTLTVHLTSQLKMNADCPAAVTKVSLAAGPLCYGSILINTYLGYKKKTLSFSECVHEGDYSVTLVTSLDP